tara:strand:- start:295 stop:717 length:423 start_codon:yes stop_codon:yes gene_type:complete
MAKNSTTFGKDKQPIKGRGKSERNKILDAMKRAGKNEDDFYDLLVTKATNPEDTFTFKELLSRLSPIPKAVTPLVTFDFPKDAKPHVQAAYVLDAVSTGVIPSDIGNMFIQSIKSMIDIEEYTDLKERIEKLEAVLNGES